MANIDPYVEQIANARYGKDVRQSIIDALVAMNAEIMASGVVTFNGRNGEVVPTNGDYDISQISATNGLQGQVPTVNSHGGFILQSPGASALNDLSDVTLTSPTSGQVLKYDGSKWINGAGGGGGGGTSDYLDLENKPQINSVTLSGNKTASDLGIGISKLATLSPNSGEKAGAFFDRAYSTYSSLADKLLYVNFKRGRYYISNLTYQHSIYENLVCNEIDQYGAYIRTINFRSSGSVWAWIYIDVSNGNVTYTDASNNGSLDDLEFYGFS